MAQVTAKYNKFPVGVFGFNLCVFLDLKADAVKTSALIS